MEEPEVLSRRVPNIDPWAVASKAAPTFSDRMSILVPSASASGVVSACRFTPVLKVAGAAVLELEVPSVVLVFIVSSWVVSGAGRF